MSWVAGPYAGALPATSFVLRIAVVVEVVDAADLDSVQVAVDVIGAGDADEHRLVPLRGLGADPDVADEIARDAVEPPSRSISFVAIA